jgi:hypothetical protein
MRMQRAVAAAAVIALAACSADAITSVPRSPPGTGPQSTQATTITGFVKVHSDEDVRLVVAGLEIRLFGAVQDVAPYDGAEVALYGRYLGTAEFWVDTVTPMLGPPATSKIG